MYLGWDLSTTQLKCVAVRSDLKLVHEASVDFDADLGSKYGVEKGVITNPASGEIVSPTAMWLEALDLVLQRLKDNGIDFSEVRGMSGAGMQHGTVFWSSHAEKLLDALDPNLTLLEQLGASGYKAGEGAFSYQYSPNWQDSSTQKQCDTFDAFFPGKEEELADVTGSNAHHRFSGPQIMRFRQNYPEEYRLTLRISLVSSFLATMFLGKFAQIDISDACGMNLWDIKEGRWHEGLVGLAAGGKEDAADLMQKLGSVSEDGGAALGTISSYFQRRYGFSADCTIAPSTGDNPATIISLPLRESDAILSLGTSTTFLMSTPAYKPDPSYHFFNHPTTAGLYMFMLCYKNGSFAREQARDALGHRDTSTWDAFNSALLSTPPLAQSSESDPFTLGLFFPRPETVPNLPALERTFTYTPSTSTLSPLSTPLPPELRPRATVESQLLSCRLRSAPLVTPQGSLPAQPRRVYLVGGASVNPALAQLAGQVLGGAEGVFRLDIGPNACALGAAYKAVWACERSEHIERSEHSEKGEHGKRSDHNEHSEQSPAQPTPFEAFLAHRWHEAAFVQKVDPGYRPGVWERYGLAVQALEKAEESVVREFKGAA